MFILNPEPTRVTTTSRTLVDVILTNKTDTNDKAGVVDFGLCDHRMVYSFLKHRVKHHPAKVITFRSKKNLDHDAMREDVKEVMKRTLSDDTTKSAEEQCKSWQTEMTKILGQAYPNKKDESKGKGCFLYNQGMERGDKEKEEIRKTPQDLTNRRIAARNEKVEERSDLSEEKVDTKLLERKIK